MLLAILTAAGTCIDPASHGAVPDDGKPDNAAIQHAIDAAAKVNGRVCLGKGVFNLEAPARPERKAGRHGSLMVTLVGVVKPAAVDLGARRPEQ